MGNGIKEKIMYHKIAGCTKKNIKDVRFYSEKHEYKPNCYRNIGWTSEENWVSFISPVTNERVHVPRWMYDDMR